MSFKHLFTSLASLAIGLAIALVAAEPPEAPPTPGQIVVAAATDLYSVREIVVDGMKVGTPVIDPETAKTVRYIWLDSPAEVRASEKKVMDGHLNLLSRKTGIRTAVQVAPWLYRIDLNDYGEQFTKAWEKLAATDWVFHEEDFTGEVEYKEVEVEYGYWQRADGTKRAGGSQKFPDEKWVTTRKEKERKPVASKTAGFAKWVVDTEQAKTQLQNLLGKQGQNNVPVLQWSQLFYETALQEDRKVGYYGMLGLKDLKDYERLIGVARRDIDPERLAELREAVANSTITIEDTLRRIVVLQAVGGHYFLTQDSNQAKLAKDDKDRGNPLFEHGDDYVFQAIEAFGNLNNGLPATVLSNDKGVLQNKAPDFIAGRDSTAPGSDDAVHVNLSCIRCHNKAGMQDVHGWVRNVLNLPPNALNGRTPEEKKKLAGFYVERRLEPAIKAFRERVDIACMEATGWKFEQFSAAYGKAWARVSQAVSFEQACLELGTTQAAYKTSLVKMREAKTLHPNLAGHALDKPVAIPRIQFIQAYPFAQDGLRGKARPFKVKVKESVEK